MIDVFMTLPVITLMLVIVALMSRSYSPALRPLLWFALAEYWSCVVATILYVRAVTGDMTGYLQTGAQLANYLDSSFDLAAPELVSMLFQQPSRFDILILGAGTNTGSMFAIAAWLLYFFRGSEYAALVFISSLSLMAALAIFRAFHHAYPDAPPRRLFVGTVLFPSVAFWTSGLLKEAFCFIGIGTFVAAWHGAYEKRWVRAILCAVVGTTVILVFRAPALPPLLLGLTVYISLERFQRARGLDTVFFGPFYVVLALAILAVGMLIVSRVSPTLAPDQINYTIASQRASWSLGRGGSGIGDDADVDNVPDTLGGQLAYVPVALLNALFRPQLFDVHNFGTLVSALEMTAVTWMVLSVIRYRGIRGALAEIQRSPFLLMCTVVTLVGSAFVGVVTMNLGTLARYRVPFLPFYGALVATLSVRVRGDQKAKVTVRAPEPASGEA